MMAIYRQSALSVFIFWLVFSSCLAMPFTLEVYPEHQTLIHRAVTSGLYQQLRGEPTLPADVSWNPAALWNLTATDKTAAYCQCLRDNGLDCPSTGNCAALCVCHVVQNLHRFPTILVYTGCSGNTCIDSYHKGFCIIYRRLTGQLSN